MKETAAHVTMARVTREESLACECEKWCETHTKLEKQLRAFSFVSLHGGSMFKVYVHRPYIHGAQTQKKDDNQISESINKSDLSVH